MKLLCRNGKEVCQTLQSLIFKGFAQICQKMEKRKKCVKAKKGV